MVNNGTCVPIEERFERYVIRSEDPEACWDWIGATDRQGYGVLHAQANFERRRSIRTINIVSYEKYIGAIPIGLFVLHKCDNPRCSNPRHLFLGTQQQNMADMVRKGRSARHERHSQAKITMAEAREIRRLSTECRSYRSIGRMFDISHGTVKAIVQNKTWKEEQAIFGEEAIFTSFEEAIEISEEAWNNLKT